MKEYIESFKIHPVPEKELYYTVYIFDDWDKMYDFCDKKTEQKLERNYNGLAHSWSIEYRMGDGTTKKDNDIGFIVFHIDEICAGVISHECSHATTYFIRYHHDIDLYDGFDIFNDIEADEFYAWTLGYLVSQVVDNLIECNIIE